MIPIIFLVLFPFVAACLLLFIKNDKARGAVVIVSAAAIAVVSVYAAAIYLGSGTTLFTIDPGSVSTIMMVAEIAFGIAIFYLGVKYKKYAASILALIQTPLMVWIELTSGHGIGVDNDV